MNKENKKLAQQKKAEQRAKAERNKKITEELKFWVPVVTVVIVVIVLIWAIVTSDDTGSGSESEGNQTTEQTSDTASEIESEADTAETFSPVLNTEAGLEVKEGDTVNIDFVGYIDGEAFEGGDTKGNGCDLAIGSGQFIDGFEDGLIGHVVGEEVTLNLVFPESYSLNPDYAGKDVVFEVTINGVYEEEK